MFPFIHCPIILLISAGFDSRLNLSIAIDLQKKYGFKILLFHEYKNEREYKIVKKNLKNSKETNFIFKVSIAKNKYLRMIKDRYISCLLDISAKDLKLGIGELNLKLKNQISFIDTLKCITFKK